MNGSIGSLHATAAARVRAAWARAGDTPPDLTALLADIGPAGEDGLIDAAVADAEERWDRRLPAGLEHYTAMLGAAAATPEFRRAILMCEASRRVTEDPTALRAEFLTRFPSAAAEVELVIGMLALISGASEDVALEDEPAPLTPGMTLGKYTLRERLGAGSFGEVWRAWDNELARNVALKILHAHGRQAPSGSGGETAGLSRVIDEARAAASLHHDHIVAVHDVGVFAENGRCYIDSELVADPAPTPEDPAHVEVGRSLEALVSASGPLGPREAVAIIEPVCRAVVTAHARGVLHRDLKPANILVSPSGRALVADFGLSISSLPRSAGESAHGTGTVNIATASGGRVVGTPAYMSPEQARGERFTPASDVYGIGATLRFALTGKPPYEPSGVHDADGRWDVIKQVRLGALSRLEAARPDLPRTLTRIVDHACAASPADRYASADALAADLHAWRTNHATVADPPGPLRAGVLWYRRNTAAATVGLVATLLLGLGVARYVERVTAERDRAVEAETLAERRLEEAERTLQVADAVNRFVEHSIVGALSTPLRSSMSFSYILAAIANRLETETPSDPLVAAGVAHFLGQGYLGHGANDHAQRYATQASRVRSALLGELAPESIRSRLLVLRVAFREPDRARYEQDLTKLIADSEQVLGRDHAETCEGLRLLSRLRVSQHRFADAAAIADDALARTRSALPAGHADIAEALIDAAHPRRLADDYDGAAALVAEAVSIQRHALGTRRYETLAAISLLGQLRMAQGNIADAVSLLREAAEGLVDRAGPTHGLTLSTVNLLARTLRQSGDFSAAIDTASPIVAATRAEKTPGTGPVDVACELGHALLDAGRTEDATEVLEWTWNDGKDRPATRGRAARAAILLAKAYRAAGNLHKARQIEAESESLSGRPTSPVTAE